MEKWTFHVTGLPHTQTSKLHCACAYTMKVFHFCKMMKSLGHTVIHYGAEGSDPECDEHVTLVTRKQQRKWFGRFDPQKLYDLSWSPKADYWEHFNRQAAGEITKRMEKKDFVCVIGGNAQKPMADRLPPTVMIVEYGIGYNGTFAKFRCFESYSHMHKILGHENLDGNGNPYDVVIPNYYDPDDFPLRVHKDNYFLFVGRLIRRKGLEIAIEVTKQIGAKLVIAGQGAISWEPGTLVTAEGTYTGDHFDYVGHVDVQRRGELMSGAKAVFVPTLYVEPFGGVAVEAQLCGTPVIASDWGAFPETVPHGQSGWRCRTLEQFIWAAKNIEYGPGCHEDIRRRALRFSLDKVRGKYKEYFAMLFDLWGDGWNTLKERQNLAWLM